MISSRRFVTLEGKQNAHAPSVTAGELGLRFDEQEMADQAPEAAPLRRRAALVLSKWVPRASDEDRPAAYGALLQLLASDDAAVQLAAINALQVSVSAALLDQTT